MKGHASKQKKKEKVELDFLTARGLKSVPSLEISQRPTEP